MPDRKYKIEFFGDSVTSGEGLAGATKLNTWVPAVFSYRNNYALLVADALDADWSIFSQSGWGYCMDWRGCTDNAIPKYYDHVCGVTSHPSQLALGAGDVYDFESSKINVAVINLGANDNGGLYNHLTEDKKMILFTIKCSVILYITLLQI
ncbi:MAG: hypothetical protein E7623_03480 [Ruminococcaceae bacterium]|nr:hypothetical protein [Oscillospiraceae bacterium]